MQSLPWEISVATRKTKRRTHTNGRELQLPTTSEFYNLAQLCEFSTFLDFDSTLDYELMRQSGCYSEYFPWPKDSACR